LGAPAREAALRTGQAADRVARAVVAPAPPAVVAEMEKVVGVSVSGPDRAPVPTPKHLHNPLRNFKRGRPIGPLAIGLIAGRRGRPLRPERLHEHAVSAPSRTVSASFPFSSRPLRPKPGAFSSPGSGLHLPAPRDRSRSAVGLDGHR